MADKNNQIGFRINKIKDFAFFIDEDKYDPTPNKEVIVKFQHNTSMGLNENIINIFLRTYFFYEGADDQNKLVDIHVENTFELNDDLKKYFNQERNIYVLPKEVIIPMVSLSISHSRALLSKNLAGTVYQQYLIPIIDPVLITRELFSYMFEEPTFNEFPKIKKQIKRKSKI